MTGPPAGLRKIRSAFATAAGLGSAGVARDAPFAVFFEFEGLVVREVDDDEDADRSACESAFDALDDVAGFELAPEAGAGLEAQPTSVSPRMEAPIPSETRRNVCVAAAGHSMESDVVCRRNAMPRLYAVAPLAQAFEALPESAIRQACHTIVSQI
jgi:hypothetical protein